MDDINIFIQYGIGDSLIYSQIDDLYKNNENFNYKYYLDIELLSDKHNNIKYLEFIVNFFKLMNITVNIPTDNEIIQKKIKYINFEDFINTFPIKKITIDKYFNKQVFNLPSEYLVLNINTRIVVINDHYNKYKFDNICNFFNNNKFKLPIILLGQQETIKTTENIHNYSFYYKLNKNNFIDKTNCKKIAITPDIDDITNDINIIKNSKHTFQVGLGGTFVMNCIFSKKLSSYLIKEDNVCPEYFYSCFFNLCNNIKICENEIELINDIIKYIIY